MAAGSKKSHDILVDENIVTMAEDFDYVLTNLREFINDARSANQPRDYRVIFVGKENPGHLHQRLVLMDLLVPRSHVTTWDGIGHFNYVALATLTEDHMMLLDDTRNTILMTVLDLRHDFGFPHFLARYDEAMTGIAQTRQKIRDNTHLAVKSICVPELIRLQYRGMEPESDNAMRPSVLAKQKWENLSAPWRDAVTNDIALVRAIDRISGIRRPSVPESEMSTLAKTRLRTLFLQTYFNGPEHPETREAEYALKILLRATTPETPDDSNDLRIRRAIANSAMLAVQQCVMRLRPH